MLTGACISRAGFNRKTGLATAVFVIAAEIPDADIFLEVFGGVFGFQHHRGITHTFVGVPFDAAAACGVVYLWRRWRERHGARPPKIPVNWRMLYFFAVLGGLSHILLDYTNAYGVRPFMPFNYHWYHWDIVSIIEPVILVALIAGLVLPYLFRLIQDEIGARRRQPGRGGALAALVIIALVWGVRDYEHRRAIGALNSLDYREELPIRVSAFPYDSNPFKWHGVIECDTFYETVSVDSLVPEVDPHRRARYFFKAQDSPVSLAAKRSPLGEVYLDWAAYPYTETIPTADGYDVRFIDLRYDYPEQAAPVLSPVVSLDPKLEVTDMAFFSALQRTKQRYRR